MSIILVVIIRSLIAFFSLLLFMRLMGKQQMAQLTFFDYVVGITIGSMASNISIELNENTLATLTSMFLWSILPMILSYLSIKSMWIRKAVEGTPTIIIENGKISEENLVKVRLTSNNLLSLLRTQGVFNITDVEYALMEPDGNLSIQKKSQKQTITPSDLNIPTNYDGLPTSLILDGTLCDKALDTLNLSKAWLKHQLLKENIDDIASVSLAQLDTTGILYVDLKDKNSSFIISTVKKSGTK